MGLPLRGLARYRDLSLSSIGAFAADSKFVPSLYHGADRSRSKGGARGVCRRARVVQRGRLRHGHHLLARRLPTRLHGARAAAQPRARLRAQGRPRRGGQCARDVLAAQARRSRRRSDQAPHREPESAACFICRGAPAPTATAPVPTDHQHRPRGPTARRRHRSRARAQCAAPGLPGALAPSSPWWARS